MTTTAGLTPAEALAWRSFLRAHAQISRTLEAELVAAHDLPLASYDVLVQLSCWENLSYTLLDAAAASLPALATDVGGNGEILPAGALLQDPTPEAIVTGVEKVVAGAVGEPHVTGREQMVAAIARVTDEVRAEMSR